MKTGHTNHAGDVLVGSARRAGVTVVSAVLGEPSGRARDADTLALLRYGLDAYEATTALPEGRIVGKIALRYRGDDAVNVVAGDDGAPRAARAAPARPSRSPVCRARSTGRCRAARGSARPSCERATRCSRACPSSPRGRSPRPASARA